jgi:hypothetical protein
MAPLTKKTIIDYIVRQATRGQFLGDGRDSKAPPITWQNFSQETLRYGAKALRARLSGLLYRQLLQEGMATVEHVEHAQAQQIASRGQAERAARDEREQANRRQLVAAMAAKLDASQSVDDLVAEFAGPLLNQHPKWSDHRCAVEIEPRLNKALRAKGGRPLKQDAIRKRVKKYRTHAR